MAHLCGRLLTACDDIPMRVQKLREWSVLVSPLNVSQNKKFALLHRGGTAGRHHTPQDPTELNACN